MRKSHQLSPQAGQAAILSVIIIMSLTLFLAFGIFLVSFNNLRISRNLVRSSQSYYLAEAGLEDTVHRIIDPDLTYATSNTLTLNGQTATMTVAENGNTLNVNSQGDVESRIRKVAIELVNSTSGVSFNYGVHVDEGGLLMKNTGRVEGNIYSNGDIIDENDATITGDAWASGVHTIRGFDIGVDAHANTIEDCNITGDAYYQSISNTSVGGNSYPGRLDPSPIPLPITSSTIDDWKNEAAAGGEITSYSLQGSSTDTLGPIKINGDLNLRNDAVLTVTGPLWVTGDILLENKAVLQLDSSYGDRDERLIADGTIGIKNDFVICGSTCGSTDSFILVLSTKTSSDSGDPAITMENSTDLDGVLYANNGFLHIKNDAALREATAYGIVIENSATLIYESGLANMNFSSGPSGGWIINPWQEVQ